MIAYDVRFLIESKVIHFHLKSWFLCIILKSFFSCLLQIQTVNKTFLKFFYTENVVIHYTLCSHLLTHNVASKRLELLLVKRLVV